MFAKTTLSKLRPFNILVVLLLTGCQSGCNPANRYTGTPVAQVMPPQAPLTQIMAAVNNNSARVQSVFCNDATITVEGAPVRLTGYIAFQRPRSLRFIVNPPIGKAELDVGSNIDNFWLWLNRSPAPNIPAGVYHGRHDQFAQSDAKKILPVEPEWLIEAFGLVTFAPNELHDGPYSRGNNQIEIRTRRRSGNEEVMQSVVLDTQSAVVIEQTLINSRNEVIAVAKCSEHRVDQASGVILPRHIELEWPTLKLRMKMDLANVQFNNISAAQADLFQRPEFAGSPSFDLSNLNFAPNGAGAMAQPLTGNPAMNAQPGFTAQPGSNGQPGFGGAPAAGAPIQNNIVPPPTGAPRIGTTNYQQSNGSIQTAQNFDPYMNQTGYTQATIAAPSTGFASNSATNGQPALTNYQQTNLQQPNTNQQPASPLINQPPPAVPAMQGGAYVPNASNNITPN